MSKKISIRDFKLNNFLFYFSYTGVLAQYTLREITFIDPNFLTWFYRVSVGVLVLLALVNLFKMPKRKILIVLLIGAILGASYAFNREIFLIVPFLFVLAAKGIKINDAIKYDLWLKIPILVIVPILFASGLTGVNNHFRDGLIRYSMGFYNPNVFSALIMSVVMEVLYLRRKKITWKEILFALLSIFLIDYFADSRTQILCILVVLGFLLFSNYNKNTVAFKNKLVKILLCFSAFIMAGFSFALVNNYNADTNSVNEINAAFSGRVKIPAQIVNQYGVDPMANKKAVLEFIEKGDKTTVDNVYMYIAIMYGVVPLVVFCALIFAYMKHANSHERKILVIIMFVFVMSGLMEKMCLRPQLDIFLLYFAYMLYGSPEEKEKIDG